MKSILDITTKANSYEVIAYDAIQDIALLEQVFKEKNEFPFVLVRNIKFEKGTYEFDTGARFYNFDFAYETYQNLIHIRAESHRKEGTI